jgi:hypothetical protein
LRGFYDGVINRVRIDEADAWAAVEEEGFFL